MLSRLLLKFWVLPPTINILIILLGTLLFWRSKKWGTVTILVGVFSLWALATPIVANKLLLSLEETGSRAPHKLALLENTAIVVLGSGNLNYSPEFRAVQPDSNAVARLNYAAFLYENTQLPIMLTGGPGFGAGPGGGAHADVLAAFMHERFNIQPRWLETKSRTTWENAIYAKAILEKEGINKIVLVTQSSHMRRSARLFRAAGFDLVTAPTQLANPQMKINRIAFWLPSTRALDLSRSVVHECFGLLWYKLFPPTRSPISTETANLGDAPL